MLVLNISALDIEGFKLIILIVPYISCNIPNAHTKLRIYTNMQNNKHRDWSMTWSELNIQKPHMELWTIHCRRVLDTVVVKNWKVRWNVLISSEVDDNQLIGVVKAKFNRFRHSTGVVITGGRERHIPDSHPDYLILSMILWLIPEHTHKVGKWNRGGCSSLPGICIPYIKYHSSYYYKQQLQSVQWTINPGCWLFNQQKIFIHFRSGWRYKAGRQMVMAWQQCLESEQWGKIERAL